MFRLFICALQFLTILPIKGAYVQEEKDLANSMIFYPLAGLAIGVTSLLCYRISSHVFISGISVVLAFVAGIIITGGLHLDGFADFCDGFYAGQNPNETLSIMKDAHIGTMAVIGLFLLLLLKLSLYYSLYLKDAVVQSLLLAPAVGRWIVAVAASLYPYAREQGTAKPFMNHITWRQTVFSSFIMLAISFFIVGKESFFILGAVFLVLLGLMRWVKKRIGGVTGDIFGAVNEITEITVLFLLHFTTLPMAREWIL